MSQPGYGRFTFEIPAASNAEPPDDGDTLTLAERRFQQALQYYNPTCAHCGCSAYTVQDYRIQLQQPNATCCELKESARGWL